jgi:hypothetical protein
VGHHPPLRRLQLERGSLVVRVTGAVDAAAFAELRKAIARAQLRYDVFAPEAYLG